MKTTGEVSSYFEYRVLDGQFLYVVSKFVALYAFLLLWIQTLLGLTGIAGRKWLGVGDDNRFHRNLGMLVICLFVAHAGLFVAGASLRNGHFAYKLLLPNLFGPYYPFMVSLGILGAVFLIVATVIAANRNKTTGFWRWGHRLTIPAFFLVYIHSFSIGSETHIGWMEYLYYVMAVGTTLALAFRLLLSRISQ